MPNKIRDIFSDDKFNLNGNLRFKDNNAYKDFLNALKLVHAEGRVVPVEGATSITIGVSYRGAIFPLNEFTNISSLSLVPVETPVSIPLVGTGQKSITLLRSQTKDSVIFKSEPNSIVSFHFIFLLDKNSCTVDYKVQFENCLLYTSRCV